MKKYISLLLCAAAVCAALAGCGKQQPVDLPDLTEIITLPVPTESQAPTNPNAGVTQLTAVLAAGEIYTLEQYPDLESADLSGSTCYATILEYIEAHPEVKVIYTVDLGGTQVANSAASVRLEPGKYTYDALMENLQYLPKLTAISLSAVNLDSLQLDALRNAYPDIALEYTINVLGQEVSADTTSLTLPLLTDDQVSQAGAGLGLLTNLTDVTLSNDQSLEQVAALQDAAPNAAFHYSFSLFGKTVSTTDEEIVYKNQAIGNEGEPELRRALTVLDGCKRFVLDNCKLDYEVLAKLREDFRGGPNVVWRVYFGVDSRYNLLTDADTLRAVYNVTNDTCSPMKYCEGVKYMDIGHNEYLTDLSFVSGMPNLEVMIASGCAVRELVGFENCKNLTWLELAYCYKLTNIDCLSECSSLTYLNLSFTGVANYQPLDGLPLKRFVCLSPKAPAKEQNTFVSIHPKGVCISVFYGYSNPYGYGWRYDDNGKTFNEYYKNVVRVAFNYDELEKYLPKDDKKK